MHTTFVKNAFASFSKLIHDIEDFPIAFTGVRTSRRSGGFSIYFLFDDSEYDDFSYSVRISDHKLNAWNSLSYDNIFNLVTEDGSFDLSKSDIKAFSDSFKRLRLEYGGINETV